MNNANIFAKFHLVTPNYCGHHKHTKKESKNGDLELGFVNSSPTTRAHH